MTPINDFKYLQTERPFIRGAKPMGKLRIWWSRLQERRQRAKEFK